MWPSWVGKELCWCVIPIIPIIPIFPIIPAKFTQISNKSAPVSCALVRAVDPERRLVKGYRQSIEHWALSSPDNGVKCFCAGENLAALLHSHHPARSAHPVLSSSVIIIFRSKSSIVSTIIETLICTSRALSYGGESGGSPWSEDQDGPPSSWPTVDNLVVTTKKWLGPINNMKMMDW